MIITIMPSVRTRRTLIALITFLIILVIYISNFAMTMWASKQAIPFKWIVHPKFAWPFKMVENEGGYDLQLKYNVKPEELPAIIIPANQVLRTSNSSKHLNFDDLF